MVEKGINFQKTRSTIMTFLKSLRLIIPRLLPKDSMTLKRSMIRILVRNMIRMLKWNMIGGKNKITRYRSLISRTNRTIFRRNLTIYRINYITKTINRIRQSIRLLPKPIKSILHKHHRNLHNSWKETFRKALFKRQKRKNLIHLLNISLQHQIKDKNLTVRLQ